MSGSAPSFITPEPQAKTTLHEFAVQEFDPYCSTDQDLCNLMDHLETSGILNEYLASRVSSDNVNYHDYLSTSGLNLVVPTTSSSISSSSKIVTPLKKVYRNPYKRKASQGTTKRALYKPTP